MVKPIGNRQAAAGRARPAPATAEAGSAETLREDWEALERSEVTDDATRREGLEALERKERLQVQAQRLESLGQPREAASGAPAAPGAEIQPEP